MTQYKEADVLVADAAARGELPIITQENRHLFGLKKDQRHADGDGWRAWWQRNTKSGTGGITHETTIFYVATADLAPDGLPWPTHWSLDLFRSLAPGQELAIFETARRFDVESARCEFDLMSPLVGGMKPVQVRCHCCGKERTHEVAKGLIDPRFNPSRCFAQGSKDKSAASLARKRAIELNAKLLEKGIFRQCDPSDYTNDRTETWFSCSCPEGGHVQLPQNVLKGCRPCQSSRRQPMANGKVSHAEMSAAAQATGIPQLSGTPFDSAWRVLRGERHPSEDKPTCLYLHRVKGHPGLYVFGITNRPSGTPKHGTWYGELLCVIWFERRSDAILVESYFKDPGTGWLAQTPADLLGEEGASELTEGEPEDFINCASDLKNQLQRMGQQDFAAEFLVGVMA